VFFISPRPAKAGLFLAARATSFAKSKLLTSILCSDWLSIQGPKNLAIQGCQDEPHPKRQAVRLQSPSSAIHCSMNGRLTTNPANAYQDRVGK
jgi:hypothetical protein